MGCNIHTQSYDGKLGLLFLLVFLKKSTIKELTDESRRRNIRQLDLNMSESSFTFN